MFYCDFCGKAFTRKYNLARHSRTKHSTPNSGYGAKHFDTIEYNNNDNNDGHSLFDTANENNLTNGSDDNSRNGENKDKDELLPLEDNNFPKEFPDKKDCFDQRILTATETIKSKFNALRKSRNDFENFKNKNAAPKELESAFMKVISENTDAAIFGAKLPELLQCALDILMIKELQNIDITDKNEENLDNEDGGINFKRSYNTINKQGNGDKINSREEIPFKRRKYDESMEYENDDNDNISSSNCVVKRYWDDPNPLVDNLRKLMSTTEIGQQIFTIMKSLNKSNDMMYIDHYPAHNKQRNELIRKLNELKKTNVGVQIFCILHELEKAEVIGSTDYLTGEEKYDSDEVDDNAVDVDEDLTAGKGLYIRPHKTFTRV